MKSVEAGSTVVQPRRKSNTDENTKTLSLGKTFKSQETKLNTKLFSYFSVSLARELKSDRVRFWWRTKHNWFTFERSVFRMLRQLRSRKGKENKRKKLHNYSCAVCGASTRAGIAAGEGKVEQAEVTKWMVIGWDWNTDCRLKAFTKFNEKFDNKTLDNVRWLDPAIVLCLFPWIWITQKST